MRYEGSKCALISAHSVSYNGNKRGTRSVKVCTIVVGADHDAASLAGSYSLLHAENRCRQRRDALGLQDARGSSSAAREGQLDSVPVGRDACCGV